MFLSFIVPVYNTEKYLRECLDSLLDQDIPREAYEVVCVNDGSTDGSLDILREYAERYTNIVIVNQENGGVAAARNAGLDVARGEYIWFFDSDDIIHPNVLKRLRGVIEESMPDRLKIGIYVFGAELTGEERDRIARNQLKTNANFYDSSVCNSVLRRDFLSRHNCRFHYPQITHGEDSIFMYEVVSHDPKQASLNIPAYLYRTRPGSAQTDKSEKTQSRKLWSYLRAALVMQQHWENQDGTERDTANLLMSFIWYSLHTSTQVSGSERRSALAQMKQAGLYPYQRPAACTLNRSYQTTRTDFVGKLFDKIYINMHRPWGYWSMWCLQKVIAFKHHHFR